MRKTISIILIMVIILMFSNLPSYALGFTINITPDKSVVTAGNTINVTISTNNLNIGGEGMNVFSCILNYDKEMFEEISESNITGLNNWIVSYNKTTNKILLDNPNFITADSDLCVISFKLKSGVELKDTIIQITEPKTSNNKIDISGTVGQTTIYVKQISSEKYEITTDNTIENIEPNTTVENFKENIASGGNITVLDKNGGTISSGNIGTGATIKTEAGEQYTLIVKGDVTGDGKITPTDLSQLKLHIVEATLLKEPYLSAGDLTGDNLVKSTDLSQMALRIVGL